jgi:hypothetical protein
MNYNETESLKEKVETNTEMKTWLVDYVGEKCTIPNLAM